MQPDSGYACDNYDIIYITLLVGNAMKQRNDSKCNMCIKNENMNVEMRTIATQDTQVLVFSLKNAAILYKTAECVYSEAVLSVKFSVGQGKQMMTVWRLKHTNVWLSFCSEMLQRRDSTESVAYD